MQQVSEQHESEEACSVLLTACQRGALTHAACCSHAMQPSPLPPSATWEEYLDTAKPPDLQLEVGRPQGADVHTAVHTAMHSSSDMPSMHSPVHCARLSS